MTVSVQQVERMPLVTVSVFTKAYESRGSVVPLTFDLAYRWNAASSATITVKSDDRRIADLRTPGARAIVRYYADQDGPVTLSMSGPIVEQSGKPRTGRTTPVTFTVEDDWVDIMQRTLGWVAPGQPITNQGAESAYYRVKGPAETVAKTIIAANCSRAGKPLTVPASAGLGSTITVKIRMHPLVDRLYPAVDDAGIGLKVIQDGGTRELRVAEQTVHDQVLSDAGGEVVDGSYRLTAPTVTRLVCGASGKKEARIFRLKVKTALETEWGFKREEFLDCRDIDYPSDDFEDDVTARAEERFAEGNAKSGCDAQLQESARMAVGREIQLGTQVQIQLGDGPVVTDVVREIQVRSTEAGLRVHPIVGLWDESGERRAYRLIAAGNKKARDLGVE